MSTLTKEWLQQTIAELEEERDAVPGAVNEDAAKALAAMRLALTSLEAEPVAWRSLYYENHGLLTGSKNVLASWQKQGWECEPLYTAPPAPVLTVEISDIIKRFQYQADHLSDWHHIDENSCKVNRRDLMTVLEFMTSCRAAMLQDKE